MDGALQAQAPSVPTETEAAVAANLRVVAAAYEVEITTDDCRNVTTILSAPPPARHHNLCGLVYFGQQRGLFSTERTHDHSGFLLSDGTYADRKRAAQVAIAAGQTTADAMTVKDKLFSEDLW